MKKVLILAYDFPPYVSVGGLRPYAWYRYFKEFGLYPIVVTRQWDNKYGNELDYIAPSQSKETLIEETEYGTIIRTPYKPNLSNRLLLKHGHSKFKLIRKIITAYYEIMQFFFFIGTKSGLYYGAKEYIKNNKVDAIIATGEPFVLFKYASKLSNLYNIPWIADYRDPWTQNKLRSSNAILKKTNAYFEKKYLSNVQKIITVSDILKFQIQSLIKNKSIDLVTNGYSISANFKNNLPFLNENTLNIAFAGSIYNWHPWKSILNCLKEIIDKENLKINITFYGINKQKELEEYITDSTPVLKEQVFFQSKMQNNQLLYKLKKHNLLLLFNDYSILGTKIYDYLAVKRRILLCYTDDKNALELKKVYFPMTNNKMFDENLQEQVIKKTQSGYVIKNERELYHLLLKLNKELKENKQLECNSINLEQYSRKAQTAKLANIILETISSKKVIK